MTRKTIDTLTDLFAIGFAVFFVVTNGAGTGALAGNRFVEAIAAFIIGLSLWRIWRRYRHLQ